MRRLIHNQERWPYVIEQGFSSISTFLIGVVVIALGTNAAIGRYAIGAVEYQILITSGRSIALTPLYLNWTTLAPKRLVMNGLRGSLLTSGLGIAAVCLLADAVPSAWPGWALVLSLPAILAYDCGRQLLLTHRRPKASIGPAALVASSAALALLFYSVGLSAIDSVWWSLAVTSTVSGAAVWTMLLKTSYEATESGSVAVPQLQAADGAGAIRTALQSLAEGLAAPVALLVVLAALASTYGQVGLHGLRVIQTLMAPLNPVLLMVSQQQWRSVLSLQRPGTDENVIERAAHCLRGSRKTAVVASGFVGAIGAVLAAGLDFRGSQDLTLLCLAWTVYVGAVAAEEALLPTLKVLIRPSAVTGWRVAVASAQIVIVLSVLTAATRPPIGVTGVITIFALIQVLGSGVHLAVANRTTPTQLLARAPAPPALFSNLPASASSMPMDVDSGI